MPEYYYSGMIASKYSAWSRQILPGPALPGPVFQKAVLCAIRRTAGRRGPVSLEAGCRGGRHRRARSRGPERLDTGCLEAGHRAGERRAGERRAGGRRADGSLTTLSPILFALGPSFVSPGDGPCEHPRRGKQSDRRPGLRRLGLPGREIDFRAGGGPEAKGLDADAESFGAGAQQAAATARQQRTATTGDSLRRQQRTPRASASGPSISLWKKE